MGQRRPDFVDVKHMSSDLPVWRGFWGVIIQKSP